MKMKPTSQVLKMIEEYKNKMITIKKSRGVWSESGVVWLDYHDESGDHTKCVFNHREGKEDYEDWDLMCQLTQDKGYYVQRFSMRYAHCAQFKVYLKRSEDCFTTNVDIDVIEGLKSMTTILVGIKGSVENEMAKERTSLAHCEYYAKSVLDYGFRGGRYGGGAWHVEIYDGQTLKENKFIGYGHDGRQALIPLMKDMKDTHYVGGYSFSGRTGRAKVIFKKMLYTNVSNITNNIIEGMENTLNAA